MTMKRQVSARVARLFMNLAPCIRARGGRVVALSDDFTHLRVRLKLTWLTRNLVGTIFGGALYSAVDPYYMLMLIRLLGRDYIVWDKSATIRFKRPARETLFADFHIDDEMLSQVRAAVALNGETTFNWPVALKSASGVIHAEFDKTLYVAKKEVYEEKLRRRAA